MNQLEIDILRALVAYWLECRAGRPMPSRSDIDPVAMPRATLPHVFLATVEQAGTAAPRFRYSLIGTAVVTATGRDVTGQEVGPETYGPNAETVLRPFRQVVAERRPLAAHLTAWWRDVPFETESVFLPLGADGRVDRILGGVIRLAPHNVGVPKHQGAKMTMTLRPLSIPAP